MAKLDMDTFFTVPFEDNLYPVSMREITQIEQDLAYRDPTQLPELEERAGYIIRSVDGEEWRLLYPRDAAKFCVAATKVYHAMLEISGQLCKDEEDEK